MSLDLSVMGLVYYQSFDQEPLRTAIGCELASSVAMPAGIFMNFRATQGSDGLPSDDSESRSPRSLAFMNTIHCSRASILVIQARIENYSTLGRLNVESLPGKPQ